MVVLIDGALAGLSATLIRDRLIPENVDVIGTVAVLIILVGFIATIAYQARLKEWLKPLVILITASLLALLVVQASFVHEVAPYGADAGSHRFLVGFRLTPSGQTWADSIGLRSTSEFIGGIGADRISTAWGWSFTMLQVLYAISYLSLVLGVVLAIGGALLADGATSTPEAHPKAK